MGKIPAGRDGGSGAASEWQVSAEAAALHRNALVWDATLPFFDYYFLSLSLTGEQAGRVDPKYRTLEHYKAAGCTYVGLTVAGDRTSVDLTLLLMSKNRAFLRANADRYIFAETVADVLRAKREGKLAVGFNFQGSDALQGNPDMVELYYQLGVRYMLLTYNVRCAAGSGCHEARDDGLSAFGRQLVREMNRVGMIVDASHTGYQTTMDIFEASAAPVIFSHSNPFGLVPHPRNIKDDQIKACAASGGVIGVVGFDGFLPGKVATVDAMVQAIDYMVQLVGPAHVGIGLDWIYCQDMFREVLATNKASYPSGERGDYDTRAEFVHPSRLPQLTEGLLKRGYAERDIRAVLGENWQRVASAVWK